MARARHGRLEKATLDRIVVDDQDRTRHCAVSPFEGFRGGSSWHTEINKVLPAPPPAPSRSHHDDSRPNVSRAPRAAGHASSDPADLRGLPEWDLTDLYRGIEDGTLSADLERAARDALAFENRWKGQLATEAGRASAGGLGRAMREYEALEDLVGRLGSYASLVYVGDTAIRSAPSSTATCRRS